MKGRFLSVLSQLHRVILRHNDGGLSDGQLLDRFIHERDDTAFEVLVWRHGPMVLGVANRVLHHLDDAEDILQATFLSLVRQARSIRRREAISGWLYQVAYRLALRARQQKKKHSLGEVAMEEVAAPAASCGDRGQDEFRLLDEELQRLPEKYRIPLVLSYLQGMTNQEIAVRMRCPIGTVFTRLARGREILRKRLIRRGVTLSAGLMGAALTPDRTVAALRTEIVRGMVRAGRIFAECPRPAAGVLSPNVIALAEGVEKMIAISRWRLIGVVLTVFAMIGSGAGLLAWRGKLHEQENAPATAQVSQRSASASTAQAKAAEPDALPADRNRPTIVQVFPADGATEVEPMTEIRIRFDRPMHPASAVLDWGDRSKAGFRPSGEIRYNEKTHEFILPVHLSPGHTHAVTLNRQSFISDKEDYEGFQSKEHIAAKPYRWSFTTKKLPIEKAARPHVTSAVPVSDSEVSLLTPLEVTFDKPMDASAYAVSFDASVVGSDRVPRLLGRAEYDAQRHRFTLLLELPANWNGELRLEGFREKNGVEAEPTVVKYRTQRSVYSKALRKRIEQAGQSDKLHQLVQRVRKARRGLRSVSEEARWAHSYGPLSSWHQTFTMQGARFQMQGEQRFLGVIDGIMRIPFRIGSDGTTAWLRIKNERIALPAKEIKEKNVLLCDAFHSVGTEDADRVIQDMKLEHLGEAIVRGRRCQRVRSWVTELGSLDYLPPIREWYIDNQTLLPLRVEMAGMGLQMIDYIHSNVNQPIPDKEFRPDEEPGTKDVKAQPLDKDYTYRFVNVIDGSNGRMSVRWGEKGPKGTRSGGLN
ncbi:MAG TPA: sigma-70 family RNA polymerase sigma factor [Gemmataceae bacterium]|nr:sigma-70 family RNA polymerase sigma factor [Gemmataceae bacterium]